MALPLSFVVPGCRKHDDHDVGETRSTIGVLSEQFAAFVSLEAGASAFRPRDFDELYTVLHNKGYVGDHAINRADAWSRSYVLQPARDEAGHKVYMIVSMGPDGILGTKDDISVRTRVPYGSPTSTSSSSPAP